MATNSTTYYNLPVFAATDQPKWLVDWNTSMEVIDGAIAQAKAAGDNAQTTANANAVAISGLADSVSTMSTAIGTLTTNVTTVTGNVQRINELIGNGTPTTTDKTIIGAINELKAEIDALAPGGAVDAADVSYDNTTSGLVADDVQDALDELSAKIGFPTRLNQGVPQYSADGGLTWVNFSGALSLDEVESAIVTIDSNNASTSGTFSGTQTYTFLEDHAEVLVTCQGFLVGYNDVTGGNTATHTVDVTPSISGGQTVTLFHDDNEYISGSAAGAGPVVKMDRKTFHIENVQAGDVLTLTYSASFTYIRATSGKLEADYVIMTIN